MSSHAAHDKLCNDIALDLSRRGAMVHQSQASGAVCAISGSWMKIGVKGKADIRATLPPNGRDLAIEVKTGSGRLNQHQRDWRDAFAAAGGLHFEVRSIADYRVLITPHLPEPRA